MAMATATFLAAAPGDITYTVQTIAGTTSIGDGATATLAQISGAEGVAVDRAGNLYIADPATNRVRKVNSNGIIQTVAGDGTDGSGGDGGKAELSRLSAPYGVACDALGNLYIADLGNHRVRKVTPDGLIFTVAGTGQKGDSGDNGPAIAAQLASPRNVAVDQNGNLYISDFESHRIRKVTPDGYIQTIAGTGKAGNSGDGNLAILAQLSYPAGIAIDPFGVIYVADSGNNRVRQITSGIISPTPLGSGALFQPTGVATDLTGNLYIAESGSRRVWKRAIGSGALGVVAGSGASGSLAALDSARDVTVDLQGNLFIADGRRVRELPAAGNPSVVAGDGNFEFGGDGGSAAAARLNAPSGLGVDSGGNLYIADEKNNRVRKISTSGIINTIAGNGSVNPSPDGSAPLDTAIAGPSGIALDNVGAAFVAESLGQRVHRVSPGGISNVAGTGASGFDGDGHPALASLLRSPGHVALDGAGSLYIVDTGNHRIRKITAGGLLFTVAGTGTAGAGGDGGLATGAQLSSPRAIAFDSAGNLYIADSGNNLVRKVDSSGNISTVAITPALNVPGGLAFDHAGNLYIADSGNHQIRKLTPSGIGSVLAGDGKPGFSGDSGPAAAAELNTPLDLAIDASGNIYVADTGNNRIRKLSPQTTSDPGPVLNPGPILDPVTANPATVQTATVVNAASLRGGGVVPGEIVTVFASDIGPSPGVTGVYGSDDLLQTTAGGAQVLFDGHAAPLFYAQDGQVNVQVPYEVTDQTATRIDVLYKGVKKATATLTVLRSAPGVFTVSGGKGPAVVINQDGTRNTTSNPAAAGSIITIFATGEGQLSPAGVDGKKASSPLPRPVLPVALAVSGRPAEILFAGSAPGCSGLLQINARIPDGVPSGPVPLILIAGSALSQDGVTLAIK